MTFLPGDKRGDTRMISVDINNDAVVEATETFQLGLSCQNPLASIDDQLGTSTIYITDQTSTLTVKKSNIVVPNLEFTINLQLPRLVLRELSM